MEKPKACIECPACKTSESNISTDGFDRGDVKVCGFTNKVIDSFYEHPGSEFIDHNIIEGCPL